jgi:Mg-chelatase subunit ChlD
MRNLTFKTIFLLSIAVMLFACKKDKSDPKTSFDIYIDFWNPTGTDPQITLDEANTSDEIKIDFTKQFEGIATGNLTQVVIDNFRIIDDNYKNYSISKITAYELNDLNEWKEDVEFTMSYERTRSLSVVLVLDRSKSLGDDFANVKQYAIEFVNRLFEETENNVQIGIVDFATTVNSLPLTNDQASITSYITGLVEGDFTAFYDAVDEAIDMLIPVDAESKAILGFTDGTDNSSSTGVTSTYLYEKLVNDDSDIKISSFMIGLEGKGGVDNTVLQKLSANGGISQFPETSTELQTAFDNFSSAIANVYNLTYTRNQQAIPEASAKQLKFTILTE